MTNSKTNDVNFLDKPANAVNKTAPKWQQKTPAKYQRPSECQGCPLNDLASGFSKPEGRGTVPLLIVAEALGEAECKDGLPLRPYAPSGSVIEKAIKDAGYTREQFVLWNVVGCRPPNNELENTWYERGAIEHCRVHFDAINQTYKPKAILALGNVALAALTGLSGKDRTVSSLRGYVLWSDRYNLPVIPTYHPSFVRRGGLKLLWVLRHDLQKAAAIAQGKFTNYVIAQTPEDIHLKTDLMYRVEPSAAELESWFRNLQDNPERFFSYDIETAYTANQDEDEREVKGREITQIQFSQAVGEGIAMKWGQEAAEFSQAVFALDNPRGGHNSYRFDNKILRLNGIEPAPVPEKALDSMLMWHHYQPDLPQKLQFVSSFFGAPFPWKHFVTQDFGLYGICDVDNVQRIYEKLPDVMRRKVSKETGVNLWDSYMDKVVNLQPILEGMQNQGIGVDVVGQQKLRAWVASEQERVNAELQPLIPAEVRKRKEWKTYPKELRPFVKQYAEWCKEAAELKKVPVIKPQEFFLDANSKAIELGVQVDKMGFKWDRTSNVIYKELDYNPNSTFQLRDLLKHFKVDIPVSIDGAETTGKGELRKLLKKSKVGEVIPIVMKTLEYRELGKAIGTYIDGKGWTPDSEGRVHTTFTFKSATWQLTIIEPNVQNVSKHTRLGGEIRKLIVPKPGYVLLEADYCSYHVLTLGFNAESQPYMDLARTDAHSYITAHMLKTRCKGVDELERETLEHIKDLDTWLQLPKEEFLKKLGWIKKQYGKTVRQQAKACIAEGSLVLTDKGLIPIQNITLDHKLWDGIEWVSHSGLIYQGIQEVITYDGITATKDHEVFLQTRTTTLLGRAASRLDRLERTGVAEQAVRTSHSYLRRDSESKGVQEAQGEMFQLWSREASRLWASGYWAYRSGLSTLWADYITQLSSTWATLRRNYSEVFSYTLQDISQLWRSGNYLQVLQPQRVYPMGRGELTTQGLQGSGDRQDRQQRALRAGELEVSNSEGTNGKPEMFGKGNVSREGSINNGFLKPLYRILHPTQSSQGDDRRGDDSRGPSYCSQQRLQVENDQGSIRTARVYDILNAGPRHRFTVDDKLVSNCILGVGLGLGVDKLRSHNEDSFNPNEEEATIWLQANPKAQFYSPIAKAMKPASYFPKAIQVMLAQEKVGKLAAKEVRTLVERLFPEVFKWQQKIRAQAHRDGYLVSRYGGIRWFHNVFEWDAKRGQETPGEDAEAAIAFFVQNDAFGKIREAMLEISRESSYGKYMVNTVHDSLVFDLPSEDIEVEAAARHIKEIMERPAKLLKHPVLCPEGLACSVELSAGLNWHELKEVKL